MEIVNKMRVFVDRIEGSTAILISSEEIEVSFEIPVKYLPHKVKEGDHLTLTFDFDNESRQAAGRKVEGLLKELTKGTDPAETKFKL